MLQLNIERMERRYEARREPEFSANIPELISAAPDPIPMEEQVRQRAYELFEARGREHGHDREDWLQAEAEMLAMRQIGASRVTVLSRSAGANSTTLSWSRGFGCS